jgi:hypothetical protein
MREVCRARSTKHKSLEKSGGSKRRLKAPFGKEQIHREKLNPRYVVGFIDGEGSFSVSIGKHKTLRRGLEVRPEFEIELRADDQEILERISCTIGCGRIYDLSYERYGWYPHSKYKISNVKDLTEKLFPFLDKYQLQAKKAEVYIFFKEIVIMMSRKEHLTDSGFEKIVALRSDIRKRGKKAKSYGNR